MIDNSRLTFNPWEPAILDEAELLALKSLDAGKANSGQQIIAIRCIVKKMSAMGRLPFIPGGPDGARATDLAIGRQFVGNQIWDAINRPMPAKKSGEENGTSTSKPGETGPIAEARRNPKPKTRPKPKTPGQ